MPQRHDGGTPVCDMKMAGVNNNNNVQMERLFEVISVNHSLRFGDARFDPDVSPAASCVRL